jgi:hypothetical protein
LHEKKPLGEIAWRKGSKRKGQSNHGEKGMHIAKKKTNREKNFSSPAHHNPISLS